VQKETHSILVLYNVSMEAKKLGFSTTTPPIFLRIRTPHLRKTLKPETLESVHSKLARAL
jgi:hypothetical protein